MIIRDEMGDILVDSRVTNLIIDQNGRRWELTDEGDGISIELLDKSIFIGISVVPLSPRCAKIKADELPRAVARHRATTSSPTKVGNGANHS